MKSVSNCPPSEQLRRWSIGDATESEFSAIEKHLRECSLCRDTVLQATETTDRLDDSLRRIPQEFWRQHEVRIAQEPPAAPSGHSVTFNQKIGPYRVKTLIGRGGMASVYRAVDENLGRSVALKVLPRSISNDSQLTQRFERECRAMGLITDRRVVQPVHAGQDQNWLYLAMEYVDGVNLTQLLSGHGHLKVSTIAEIGVQTAEGLQAVHDHGLIHRDVKPTNLMVDREGKIRILDLGVAILTERTDTHGMTSVGQFVGTLEYAAPEQIDQTHEASAASDQYSLACALHFLLTGAPPFARRNYSSTRDLLSAQLLDRAPDLGETRDDVPTAMAEALAEALSKRPDARFASMAEFASALGEFAEPSELPRVAETVIRNHITSPLPPQTTAPEKTNPESNRSRPGAESGRRRLPSMLAGSALGAGLAALGFFLVQAESPVVDEPEATSAAAGVSTDTKFSLRNFFTTAGPHRGFDPTDGHPVAQREIVIQLETNATEPRSVHYYEAPPGDLVVRIRPDRANLFQTGRIVVARYRSEPGTDDMYENPNLVQSDLLLTAEKPQVALPITHGTHKQGFFPAWIEKQLFGRMKTVGTEGLQANNYIFYCYPDLTFENATIESVVAKSSQELQLTLDVYNRGTFDAQEGEVGISFQRDSTALANNVKQRARYPAIAAGERHSMTIPIRVPRVKESQILYLAFRVDIDNSTRHERDELPIENWDYRTDDFIALSYDKRQVPANNAGIFRLEVQK